MTELVTTPARPTLAFIYDRHATLTTVDLELRIERCRRYAVERGWVVAAEWVDRGDDALTNWMRPRWDQLIYAMQQAAAPAVCLVADWDRISRDPSWRGILRMAVAQAGGYCVTAAGEDDRQRETAAAPLALRGRP